MTETKPSAAEVVADLLQALATEPLLGGYALTSHTLALLAAASPHALTEAARQLRLGWHARQVEYFEKSQHDADDARLLWAAETGPKAEAAEAAALLLYTTARRLAFLHGTQQHRAETITELERLHADTLAELRRLSND